MAYLDKNCAQVGSRKSDKKAEGSTKPDSSPISAAPMLDSTGRRELLSNHLGCQAVKQTHCVLVLLLLGTVACASTVPPVDDPETAFDEGDAPISLALPTLLRITLSPPAADSIILPRPTLCSRVWGVDNSVHRPSPRPNRRSPYSLQKLLCTFLI